MRYAESAHIPPTYNWSGIHLPLLTSLSGCSVGKSLCQDLQSAWKSLLFVQRIPYTLLTSVLLQQCSQKASDSMPHNSHRMQEWSFGWLQCLSHDVLHLLWILLTDSSKTPDSCIHALTLLPHVLSFPVWIPVSVWIRLPLTAPWKQLQLQPLPVSSVLLKLPGTALPGLWFLLPVLLLLWFPLPYVPCPS